MIETKSHDYAWSKSWIEFKAPNASGVYWLRDKEGKVLFVGKGNVRERLLSHWYKEHSTDSAIWNNAPYTFRFELTNDPAQPLAIGEPTIPRHGKHAVATGYHNILQGSIRRTAARDESGMI